MEPVYFCGSHDRQTEIRGVYLANRGSMLYMGSDQEILTMKGTRGIMPKAKKKTRTRKSKALTAAQWAEKYKTVQTRTQNDMSAAAIAPSHVVNSHMILQVTTSGAGNITSAILNGDQMCELGKAIRLLWP